MSCTVKQIKDNFLSKIRDKIKDDVTTVMSDHAFITYRRSSRQEAFNAAERKVLEIQQMAEKEFGEKFSSGFTSIDQTPLKAIRLNFHFPVKLFDALRVKKGQLKLETYQSKGYVELPTDLTYDANKEYRDEIYFSPLDEEYSPDPADDISKEDDKTIAAYVKLPPLLRNTISGEVPSIAMIKEAIKRYNVKRGLSLTNIPDYTDKSVINKLMSVINDLTAYKIDVDNHTTAKEKAKIVRETITAVANNKAIREHLGTFKPMLRKLDNLIDNNLETIARVRINLKEAQLENNEGRVTELLRRIATLEANNKEIQSQFDVLASLFNYEPMIEVAKEAMIKINDILTNSISGKVDIDALTSATYLLDYWNELLNDPEGIYKDYAEVESDPAYALVETMKNRQIFVMQNGRLTTIEKPNDNAKSLNTIMGDLKTKNNKALDDFLVEVVEEKTGLTERDEILKQVEEATWIRHNVASLERSDRVLEQSLAFMIHDSKTKGTLEAGRLIAKVDSALKALKDSMTENEIWDKLMRKSKRGYRTQELKMEYVQEYWDEYEQRKLELEESINEINANSLLEPTARHEKIKEKRNKHREYLRDRFNNIDIELMYGDRFKHLPYLTVKNYTDADREQHKNYLISIWGKKKYDAVKDKQDRLIDEWFHLHQSSYESAIQLIGSTATVRKEDVDAEFVDVVVKDGNYYGIHKKDYNNYIIDDIKSNPLIYSNWTSKGEQFEYNKLNIYTSPKFLVNAPKKYNNDGSETGYYDKGWEEIQNNPELKQLYDIVLGVNKEIFNNLPYHIRRELRVNMITAKVKGFFEGITQTRLWDKPIYTAMNFAKEFLKNRSGMADKFAEFMRGYDGKFSVHDPVSLKKIQTNFDVANKKRVDSVLYSQVEERRLELMKEGLTKPYVEHQLSIEIPEMRELIVHNLMVEEVTQDVGVTVKNMILLMADEKHRREIAPYMRLYEKGMDNQTLNVDKPSEKRAINYKTQIRAAAGIANNLYHNNLKVRKVELDTEEDKSNRLYRTAQENKEVDDLKSLYKKYKEAHSNGEITDEFFGEKRKEIETRLSRLSINTVTALDKFARILGYTSTARSLFWGMLSPISNRISGIGINMFKAAEGRSYSPGSYYKALKLLGKSNQFVSSLGMVAGFIGGAAIGATALTAIPLAILGTWAGYNAGISIADIMQSKDPLVKKLMNIIQVNDIVKWGDPLINEESLESRLDRKLEALKPMTLLRNVEIINAAEQVAAFLIEMKPWVKKNGEKIQVTGWDLYNEDGTIADYETYYNPINDTEMTKDQLTNWLGKMSHMVSATTGQYDSSKPIQLTRSPLGQLYSMFSKWKYNELMRWTDAAGIKNYGTVDLVNKKEYQDLKGRLTTLIDIYGLGGTIATMGMYSAGAAYFAGGYGSAVLNTVGLAAFGSAAMFALPILGIGVAASFYSYKQRVKRDRETGTKTPAFLENLSKLLLVTPFGYAYEMKKNTNSKVKKFYDDLSIEDQANIKNMRLRLTTTAILFLMILALNKLVDDKDDDEEPLTAIIRTTRYVATQTSGNLADIVNIDSVLRDVKSNGGSQVGYSFIEAVGKLLKDAINAIDYNLNPNADETHPALYQNKDTKFGRHEKGDYKMWNSAKNVIPLLRSHEQLERSKETMDKENNKKGSN